MLKEKAASTVAKIKQYGLALLALALMGLASMTPASAQTLTIPDVSGYQGTFADTQTFATNLVSGPGKYAIYIGLVMLGFSFVWRMIKRAISH